jgi:hypothetical protein
MERFPHSLRHLLLAAMMIATLCAAQTRSFVQFGKIVMQDSTNEVFWLKTPLPLGAEAYHLLPMNRNFYVLACIEDSKFDNLHVSRVRNSAFVIDSDGRSWRNYPAQVTFRVTATGMADVLSNLDSSEIKEDTDFNSFLLGLKFRLKVYHGLNMRIMQPSSQKLIGMPADLPADERVFRVSFDTHNLPVDDRLVLEVLTPGGQLLSRFHLELL